MKKALIRGSDICQIVELGEEFPIAPGLAWVDVPDDTTVQDAWDGSAVVKWAPPLATAADVKAEARRRIVSRYPDWKQANMTARGLELVSLGVNITADEAAEMDALRAAWSWIKSVRAASDAIEVRLAEQPDLDIAADHLWPAG